MNFSKISRIFGKILAKICFFCKKTEAKVAHVNLSGVIGKDSKFSSGLNIENAFPLLKKAFETSNIKAVAITINSPGGSPVQSELIYKAIREFAGEKKIPVYTFAQDVAASGGYWLLLAGDEIYAHQASIIGSIGVIFSGFGFVDLIKKIGVERRVYTEGKNKAILDPFMPEEQENIAILKEAQHDIFEGFRELVLERRKAKLKDAQGKIICVCQEICDKNEASNKANCCCKGEGDKKFLDEKVFTGAFWSGKKAHSLGLVDEIADMRSKMQEKFGKKVKIEQIESKKGLIKSLFSSKNEDFVQKMLNLLEEKSIFGRFGL